MNNNDEVSSILNNKHMNYNTKKFIKTIINNNKLTNEDKNDILDEYIEYNKILNKWNNIKKDFYNF